ncbi:phosphoribosylaminoimidazolesuccinocarboxamide synthase [Candidatus Liberibacter africanus]|uniref:Phosphoribosylaminoimidazole-succinocarboxamide synthase n=1 Tax=Candidatus Liberibacter africanus PTSAPSY TaxID=1277257 RepID=A0A0G3I7P5_LIBAF|nr:phosphoribosylaminoimidazolesuccinocarboxamide synthase [Candidatus Liberibacter africanus]AKK20543.1 phosphoribosylaminoimidazole-succinocarboxamide synthase [Candidatus Liberibacter africanus PTSAPSY]QTP64248.1 phosphoribosylaminoimidazolesuccinocarboxamide synthase [Candidatus Liberibacter africanus]
MRSRNPIYEGKTKIVYEGLEPGTLIQFFKDDNHDDNHVEDTSRCAILNGKGVLNNRISEHMFTQFNKIGIPHYFIRRINMREQLVRDVEMIPLLIVVRNTVAGSLAKRLNMSEGLSLPRSIVEFYYKPDCSKKTLVSEEHITAFNWATQSEIEEITALSLRINDFITGLFLGINIQLVDFRIKCGRLLDGDIIRIVLSDEIFPDCCRLWDISQQDECDKQRFSRGNNQLLEGYSEVARRLGIFKKNEPALKTTLIVNKK